MLTQIQDIVDIFGTAFQTVAAIAVAIIAYLGLQTWKQQMIGQAKYKAVSRFLLLARQFRDAFRKSRRAITRPHEYAGRKNDPSETEEEAKWRDEEYALLARLQPAMEVLLDLEQAAWEIEVITGETVMPQVEQFSEVIREVKRAIAEFGTGQLKLQKYLPNGEINPSYKRTEEKAELIYVQGDDGLNERVDAAISALETKLKKYMRI